jgi:hypothetical protein
MVDLVATLTKLAEVAEVQEVQTGPVEQATTLPVKLAELEVSQEEANSQEAAERVEISFLLEKPEEQVETTVAEAEVVVVILELQGLANRD